MFLTKFSRLQQPNGQRQNHRNDNQPPPFNNNTRTLLTPSKRRKRMLEKKPSRKAHRISKADVSVSDSYQNVSNVINVMCQCDDDDVCPLHTII